ncbi:hypothetical protein ACGF7U_31365 [Micromonospora sp. NPDC047670]|uniref:hypothetical protein n=1 Tax=Micromonospora sp. NPDC047670 TaxID=3364252 RepID=UPI00371F6EF7
MTAMDPERRRRLVALGDLHREWADRHEKSTPFDPDNRPQDSDYNQHHVDVDADAAATEEFVRRADRIMGVDR